MSMRFCAVGASLFAAMLGFSQLAHAGYYTCAGGATNTNGHCSDGSMAIYHADTIKPDQGHSIAPDRGQGGRGNHGSYNGGSDNRGYDNGGYDNSRNRGGWGEDRGRNRHDNHGWHQDSRDRDKYQSSDSGSADALFGAWSTNVGGAVWTSPSVIPGWDTLHVSPGALAGLLVIYPNGTYVWNSYGGKRGRWRRSGDADYPITLIDTVENKLWNVGLDGRHPGHIYINESHGYYYYTGRRP